MFKYYLKNIAFEKITLYMPRNQKQVDEVINLIKNGK